ncbi:nitrite reductase small subunit NirD [Thalassotalea sp. PS06]|uniref:nitrite reductase small subunit NirD n=1 Tax=Thalassotalea sp. PS06 TaxID=2594005 RepID=UPI0011641C8B|nr:nitrite reductase small subunit NirD [Thalassotalea sp. PS06]QDP00142.1 nitrite reductase small subunit NirD [Thalassotalea sp. PS06]
MTTLAYAEELEVAVAQSQWIEICQQSQLIEDTGVAALLDNGAQVAIFHLPLEANKVFAVGNFDPIGEANVLYRGIVGSVDGEPVVASPLYKQHFSLVDGRCLDDESVSIAVYPARIVDGKVELSVEL